MKRLKGSGLVVAIAAVAFTWRRPSETVRRDLGGEQSPRGHETGDPGYLSTRLV
jgi:hypothetical protein